jgi:manganese/zinc/iron transport system substrate-binding protein
MVGDIVAQVAGEHGNVHTLIGSGIDPHLYKPTRDDVATLMRADVIFYNGLLLEGKMTDVLVRLARTGKPVYAVTEIIPADYLIDVDGSAHHDPHVWMDVSAWRQATHAVGEALAEFDPPNAAAYRANAARYMARLESLDSWVRAQIASIPRPQRLLITAHDAFGYFGRAYDIEVHGIQGLSTESEAGLQDLQRLVDLIVSRQVRAIFVETSVADKNVRALVEGARARGHSVEIGGELFSDAMGAPGTPEGTYVGMIEHNVRTIVRALGGQD